MRVLDAAQMREADRRTIEDVGVPSIVLMERAGQQVVEAMASAFDDLASRRVTVLCGRGNNGGDGFVVARYLHRRGIDADVFVLGALGDVRGDARTQLDALVRTGLPVVEAPDGAAWARRGPDLLRCDLIVDAIFGTGLSRPLDRTLQAAVADVNAAPAPVVSIDLPTGLSADSHRTIGPAVQAAVTVTLGAPKLPLVLPPGDRCAGKLVVADIGIPPAVIDAVEGQRIELLTPAGIRRLVPERAADAHKGDFGRVLIVAGSLGKTGAACLAGLGALRSGAGLVTVATPRSCVAMVAACAPEYMTLPLPETADGAVRGEALDVILDTPCDVLAAGPGLGKGEGAARVAHGLLERARKPVVLDADAINVCADATSRIRNRGCPDVVLTPHPGEMARLCGGSADDVQNDRVAAARRFAAGHRAHVVLKGARTIVAAPDGAVHVNPTGNPGMATGGTGDVLTGVVAAWLAQLADVTAACDTAVYLHGLAGDLAAEVCGEVAMTASDLAAALGRAVRETTDPESR